MHSDDEQEYRTVKFTKSKKSGQHSPKESSSSKHKHSLKDEDSHEERYVVVKSRDRSRSIDSPDRHRHEQRRSSNSKYHPDSGSKSQFRSSRDHHSNYYYKNYDRKRKSNDNFHRSHPNKYSPEHDDRPNKEKKHTLDQYRHAQTRREMETPQEAEERDNRTIFVWQLSARVNRYDLYDFFSPLGRIIDVRLIMDTKTQKSKGIAYIEFAERDTVELALKLNNTRFLGVPIQIQRGGKIQENGVAVSAGPNGTVGGPGKLYVGSLDYNVTEAELYKLFAPYGRVEIKLMKDSTSGRSQGFGFLTLESQEMAKKALDNLNGYEIAGRPMKVGHIIERSGETYKIPGSALVDADEMDRAGVDLGPVGRISLMKKLAEGTGLNLPKSAESVLQMSKDSLTQAKINHHIEQAKIVAQSIQNPGSVISPPNPTNVPSRFATPCFKLSNVFDPVSDANELDDIRSDVIDECNKHGGVVHVHVDRKSLTGDIYVKCLSVPAAQKCVASLHGRYFSGRMISAFYEPLSNYYKQFPESLTAKTVITS